MLPFLSLALDFSRFHVDTADWLDREDKIVLKERLGNIITKDGWILVKSDKTRSSAVND